MNNLDAAKNASVNTRESSDYTNLLSLHHIITTNFPTARSAWEDYMQRCDRLLEKADPNTKWDMATKALGKSNGKLLGDKKPEWNDELPRWLWDQGVGLCTAFAIAASQSSKIDATYNEYTGKHRNATKTATARPVQSPCCPGCIEHGGYKSPRSPDMSPSGILSLSGVVWNRRRLATMSSPNT